MRNSAGHVDGEQAVKIDHDALKNLDPRLAATLVEKVASAAWATDPDGAFLYVTPTAPAFRGLTPEALNASGEPGGGWRRLVHADDYDAVATAWRQALKSGVPYRVEHRTLGASGGLCWTRATGYALRDGAGRITGWYGSLIEGPAPFPDLQPSDQRLPDVGEVHPHDRASVAQASARAFFHGVPQISSYRQLQADGSYRWVELRVESEHSASVDPGLAVAMQNAAWTVAEDLGETVEAVRAAQMLENLYGGAWALDARGRFTYATPTAQTSIGLTLDDLNEPLDGREFIDGGDHGWKRTVHPDDYEQMAAGFRNGLRRGEAWNVEYRILRANGDYVWHRVGARPTRDDHGRVTGWYGISLDIDVYKKTEAAFRESEQRLRQLIDAVPAQIWSLTPEGDPSYINKRLADVVGVRLEDLVSTSGGRSLADVHPDDRPAVDAAIERSLATGEPLEMRYRQHQQGGSYRWTEARLEADRDDAGKIVQWYGVCFDIDNEVRAQEALRLAQERLARASQAASLSELSASIAHEVNQPLAAVVANAQACVRWLQAEPMNLARAQISLERIIRDANAASDVVGRVRALFNRAAPTRAPLSLSAVIAEAERLLSDTARARGVNIEVDIESDLPAIDGDAVQIQQVLINLMRNGIEAMAQDSNKTLHVCARRDGAFSRVEVADEGVGIPDPEHVFEPFFTTKPNGMGMGLAISRSIVETHGGRVLVDSRPGDGTRFTFTLPLDAAASRPG